MSSERAGTPTHGRLDRAAIRNALGAVLGEVSNYPHSAQVRLWGVDLGPLLDKAIDAVLEARVVPDPRITRIEALLTGAEYAEYEESGATYVQTESIRAILQGNQ